MAANHGTRSRYLTGCRCDDCKYAQRLYQGRYRERKANVETRPHSAPVVVAELPQAEAGPESNGSPDRVEAAVESELAGMAGAEARPGLVQIALAMSRILDSSRAASAQPAAAKVLVMVLDTLRKGSAQGRRGNLAVVKSMTTSSPSA
jgi:hypothetical protein